MIKEGTSIRSIYLGYIGIESGENYANNEIILEEGVTYNLTIDYPLKNPYTETLIPSHPYNRQDVIDLIRDRYKKIYEEEGPGEMIPGMLNREKTDGKYGIWGHFLEDLILHHIHIDANNNITLGIDS